jgi:poly-gamma-glutamate synthesis protein (capsule biosynthesis protein)
MNMKKAVLILIILLITAFIIKASFIYMDYLKEIENISKNLKNEPQEKQITIIMVGDVMLDRGIRLVVEKYGNNDYFFPFEKISDYLKTADIISGNLEGPVSDKGTKVGSIYSFRSDPKAIEGLKQAGFNLMMIANNHAFDYGRLALEDTLTRLTEANIAYVGAGFNKQEAFGPLIKEIKGKKIAFLEYTDLGSPFWAARENSSGIAWVSEENMEEIKENIKQAREQSDFLIVSLHSGNEYQEEPSQFQKSFAKQALEAGADLAIGHHAHIIQTDEKNIYYGLGNFVFDQSFSEETMEGEIIRITITPRNVRIMPLKVKLNQYFQPELTP